MIQLDSNRLSQRKTRLVRKMSYGGVESDAFQKKLDNCANVSFMMMFDNNAVELQLSNLINTYGVGKVQKILNELTKLKKVA